MTKLSLSFAAAALMTAAGATSAQFTNPGDILFTTEIGGTIRNISGTTPGGSLTLWSSPEFADTALAGIDRAPNGNFYVADGRNPNPGPETVNSGIIEVTDLFGTPASSYITRGNPLQRPIGLKYDSTTDRLLTNSNPGTFANPTSQRIDGIFSVSLDGSTVDTLFTEATTPGGFPAPPRYQAGTYFSADPDSNDWWVASINGGVDLGTSPNVEASTITRLAYNGGTNSFDLVDSPTVIDLSASATGAPNTYNNLRDIVALPGDNGGTDIYFTDSQQGVVGKLVLDASDNLLSISEIVTGVIGAGTMEFNPFTDQLVFVADNAGDGSEIVYSVNLDGSGLTTLHQTEANQGIRGLYIIPAPGSVAVLGLAGLAAVRRRR